MTTNGNGHSTPQVASMMSLKKEVLDKLYFRRQPSRTVGLKHEIDALYSIMEDTVTLRRGDSCFVIGPRNSGKTLLVQKCIELLEKNYKDQALFIRLSGLLHTDDRIAFREIARQIDKATGEQKDRRSIEHISMETTLGSVLELFRQVEIEQSGGGPERISVFFIVEDIDTFTGLRQGLLYNLLDLSKSSSLGVTVIGESVKLNTQDRLEKRVRSRFGSVTLCTRRPRSREQFEDIALALLESEDCPEWTANVSQFLAGPLKQIVGSVYYTTNNPRELGVVLAPIIQRNFDDILGGNAPNEVTPVPINTPSTTETRVRGLCELDWAILICAVRAKLKYGLAEINFVLTDREYREMAAQLDHERSQGFSHAGYRTWSAKAVLLAWERLQASSLLSRPMAPSKLHRDLTGYRVDASLDELRMLVPQDHPLYSWTRL